jgi:hypothetical protein
MCYRAGEPFEALSLHYFVHFVQYTYMQILTTTEARKSIKELVNGARYLGKTYAIGRRHSIDALLIGFPADYSEAVNDITNANTYSRSFDFLKEEPDLYTSADLKKTYA